MTADLTLPPMPPVERYGAAMSRFALAAMRVAVPPRDDAPHIAMYVTPWYRQAAGWFAVALGIALATRTGARVSFIVNDMPYPAIHPDELNEIAAFDAFCRAFEGMFPFHRLGAFAGPAAPALNAVVDEALSFDLRHRTGAGTLPLAQAPTFARTARTPLIHLTAALDRLLVQTKPDVLFVPGGVANGSYVPKRLAALHNIRFASADSAFGSLLVAAHGIAAHGDENAETHKWLSGELAQKATARGHEILASRIKAAASVQAPPCDLLMPLGYDYDTAALGIGSLYRTQDEWLRDTINVVTARVPTAKIVVRQHPHEARYPCAENTAMMAELGNAKVPNLHLMKVGDPTPVYALLTHVKAVAACQSTVVLEAQMLGIPSVAARDKNFVHAGVIPRPATREAYYQWLTTHLAGDRVSLPQVARDAAASMYFLMQDCWTTATRFTPHASDLWAWLHGDPVGDLASPTFIDLLRCFAADVPLTTLRARRILGLSAMPDGVRDPLETS